jgi:hypothetical protein
MVQPMLIPLANTSPREWSGTGLRVIKTHLPQQQVPYSSAARYIALTRNPKDVIVSSYHFARALLYGPLMPSVSHWVDLHLSGSFAHGSWAQHVASYYSPRSFKDASMRVAGPSCASWIVIFHTTRCMEPPGDPMPSCRATFRMGSNLPDPQRLREFQV